MPKEAYYYSHTSGMPVYQQVSCGMLKVCISGSLASDQPRRRNVSLSLSLCIYIYIERERERHFADVVDPMPSCLKYRPLTCHKRPAGTLAYLRYANSNRPLLAYSRSLLKLTHASGMPMLIGLFCHISRPLLAYYRSLLTRTHT